MAREKKQIAKNRKAFHDYEIIETFEAGIALTGTEVCSLRENNCQLTDCFALVRNLNNPDPDRKRKLLLHRKQIRYLEQKTREAGLAIVPIGIYFSTNGLVKLEIALARGKKLHDKRQAMAERDSKREIARALKMRSR